MKPAKTVSNIAPNTPAAAKIVISQIPARGLPADAFFITEGRKTVAKLPLIDGTELNIKQFPKPGLLRRCIYGWWRGSKARRAFHNALPLGRLDICTPTPYGFLEEYSPGGLMGYSYYFSQQLPADFTDLHGIAERDDFEQLVEALATFVARIHRKGVWMKTLSADNLLVRTETNPETGEPAYRFALVNLAEMDFDVTDLKKLIRSCSQVLDDEEKLVLFAGRYAEILGVETTEVEDLLLASRPKKRK